MDTILHEDYEVPQFEIGLAVSCFCPICKAQVFGYLHCVAIDDLVTHMNEVHVEVLPGGRTRPISV